MRHNGTFLISTSTTCNQLINGRILAPPSAHPGTSFGRFGPFSYTLKLTNVSGKRSWKCMITQRGSYCHIKLSMHSHRPWTPAYCHTLGRGQCLDRHKIPPLPNIYKALLTLAQKTPNIEHVWSRFSKAIFKVVRGWVTKEKRARKRNPHKSDKYSELVDHCSPYLIGKRPFQGQLLMAGIRGQQTHNLSHQNFGIVTMDAMVQQTFRSFSMKSISR